MNDIRYACRVWRQHTALLLSAVLGLSLAMAVATAMVSLTRSLISPPSGIARPDDVAWFRPVPARENTEGRRVFTYPQFETLRERAITVEVAAIVQDGVPVETAAVSAVLPVWLVSDTFFPVMRAPMTIGRGIRTGDGVREAVLSHGLWLRRFGGDPAVLGQRVRVAEHPHVIVGVAGRGFSGPTRYTPALWIGLPPEGVAWRPGGDVVASVVGRTREGFQRPAVQGELAALMSRDGAAVTIAATPIASDRGPRPVTVAVSVVVAVLVLIAWGNALGLLLASAHYRRPELALRVCLGARPSRLARQFLTEGLLLTSVAGLIAWPLFVGLIPLAAEWLLVPPGYDITPDHDAFALLAGLSIAMGLAAGLFPARQARAANPVAALRGHGPAHGDIRALRVPRWILAWQSAMSMVLLVVSALLIRGAWEAAVFDIGIDADRLISVQMTSDGESRAAELAAALTETGHVTATASASQAPFSGASMPETVTADGQPHAVLLNRVSADYFRTLGIAQLAGRTFERREEGHVAIVSEILATRLSRDGSVLGAVVRIGREEVSREIVGVVSDAVTTTIRDHEMPAVYVPLPAGGRPSLILRTKEAAPAILSDLRAAAVRLGLEGMVAITPVTKGLSQQTRVATIPATLASAAGLLGWILAIMGLYSLSALVVSQRSAEIGVRLAMGGSYRRVVRDVLGPCLRPVAAGTAVGALVALAAGSLLASQLYGASPYDPLAHAGALMVLLAGAVLGTIVPVTRIARVDPARTLRRL